MQGAQRYVHKPFWRNLVMAGMRAGRVLHWRRRHAAASARPVHRQLRKAHVLKDGVPNVWMLDIWRSLEGRMDCTVTGEIRTRPVEAPTGLVIFQIVQVGMGAIQRLPWPPACATVRSARHRREPVRHIPWKGLHRHVPSTRPFLRPRSC